MGSVYLFFFSENIWVVFESELYSGLCFSSVVSSLIFLNGLADSFFSSLFGVGLMRLFFLSSVDLLSCLVLLVSIVYMGFLQHGCLELLINWIWGRYSKFYSVDTTHPCLCMISS